MPTGKSRKPPPGTRAVRQAKQGDYKRAVQVVARAMKSSNTGANVAARSRTILSSTVGAEVFRRAKKRARKHS